MGKEFFEKEKGAFTKQWEKAKKYHAYLGNGKLAVIALFFYLLYRANQDSGYTLWCGLVFITVGVLWFFHRRAQRQKEYCEQMVQIYQDYIYRAEGNWNHFDKLGSRWISPEHDYGHDLDIVGKGSLFQWLNTSVTGFGEKKFAGDLLQLKYQEEEIKKRAEAIEALAKDMPFKTAFQYQGRNCGSYEEASRFIEELSPEESYIANKPLKTFLYYLPMVTVPVMIFSAIFLNNRGNAIYYILLFHGVIWLATALPAYRYTKSLGEVYTQLYGYDQLFHLIQNQHFTAGLLQQLQEEIGQEAEKAMKKLKGLSQKAHIKNNIILYAFLNLFLLWDHSIALELDAWKKNYAPAMALWFEKLGELESMICFSNVESVLPHSGPAQVKAGVQGLEAVQMGHPFIKEGNRVYNDIHFENGIIIISGSNMSGKTTFLRTIGINMVLAMNGSRVCAESFCTAPYTLATSMRIADSLQEGVSTFYQELKKIRRILDLAEKKNRRCLFLIDEIFRGTNSADRLSGAQGVLMRLNACGTGGFITTHDLELCKLEEIKGIKNMHFDEYYQGKEIHFDYKIKPGPTVSANGRFLMEMLDIL